MNWVPTDRSFLSLVQIIQFGDVFLRQLKVIYINIRMDSSRFAGLGQWDEAAGGMVEFLLKNPECVLSWDRLPSLKGPPDEYLSRVLTILKKKSFNKVWVYTHFQKIRRTFWTNSCNTGMSNCPRMRGQYASTMILWLLHQLTMGRC